MPEQLQQSGLTIKEKRRILYEEGEGIQDELLAALGKPMLDLVERAGNFAADNPEALHQALYFHPVDEMPYTVLPPDMPQPLPRSKADIKRYAAAFWPRHEQNQHGFAGIHDLELLSRGELLANVRTELEAVLDERATAPENWEVYAATYKAEQNRGFISLPAIAADCGRRKYAKDNPFLTVERAVIGEYYTYRYPGSLLLRTSEVHSLADYIMTPLAPEADRSIAEKRLRAAAFIIDWIAQDTAFHDAMVKAEAAHPEIIRKHTVRAQDLPEDAPMSPIHGFQESVGRAILPLLVKLTAPGKGTHQSMVHR